MNRPDHPLWNRTKLPASRERHADDRDQRAGERDAALDALAGRLQAEMSNRAVRSVGRSQERIDRSCQATARSPPVDRGRAALHGARRLIEAGRTADRLRFSTAWAARD